MKHNVCISQLIQNTTKYSDFCSPHLYHHQNFGKSKVVQSDMLTQLILESETRKITNFNVKGHLKIACTAQNHVRSSHVAEVSSGRVSQHNSPESHE